MHQQVSYCDPLTNGLSHCYNLVESSMEYKGEKLNKNFSAIFIGYFGSKTLSKHM